MFEILTGTNLFNGIVAANIEKLLSKTTYRIKKYSKGQVIALMGETCESLSILIEGSVKGEMLDFSGKTITIEDIKAPDPIAPAFIFGSNNKYPVNIIANQQTKLLIIHKDELIKLLQSDIIILKNFLRIISSRAQFLSNKIKFLSFKTIKGKFLQYLLKHGKKDRNEIVLQRTQTELAESFGVTRPSLARAIAELEKDKIIETNKKKINILNWEKLNSLLR